MRAQTEIWSLSIVRDGDTVLRALLPQIDMYSLSIIEEEKANSNIPVIQLSGGGPGIWRKGEAGRKTRRTTSTNRGTETKSRVVVLKLITGAKKRRQ